MPSVVHSLHLRVYNVITLKTIFLSGCHHVCFAVLKGPVSFPMNYETFLGQDKSPPASFAHLDTSPFLLNEDKKFNPGHFSSWLTLISLVGRGPKQNVSPDPYVFKVDKNTASEFHWQNFPLHNAENIFFMFKCYLFIYVRTY